METLEFFKDELSGYNCDCIRIYAIKHNNMELLQRLKTIRAKFTMLPYMHAFGSDTVSKELRIYVFTNTQINEERWNGLLVCASPYPEAYHELLEYRFLGDDNLVSCTPTSRMCEVYAHTWNTLAFYGNVTFCRMLGLSNPTSDMLCEAINENHMEMVEYLLGLKCEWPAQHEAAKRNHFTMLQYIHEQGYPCSGSCHTYYHANRIPFCSPPI
jgi:hypothetical protein